MPDRIVIIGGVACGPKAAARARRRNPDAEIVIIEQGEHISYAGCGIPYYVGGSVGELAHLWTTQFELERDVSYFKAIKDIDVRVHTKALSIDRGAKRVRVRNMQTGDETDVPYDRLVLATGATPVRPPIEGIDGDRVFSLHVPQDGARIRELVEAGEVDDAVIIGGGSIGLEAAESFFAHGVDITIVEREDQLLPKLLDPDMAAFVKRELEGNDLNVLTAETVTRIESGGNVITDKREIDADIVLVAVGVAPNVALAQEAGLNIGTTGAIAVNEYLETSDPSIYAGGDCVESTNRITGQKFHAPLGSTANKHGRVIGDNLTGGREAFPGVVGTAVLKSMGVNIARTGLTVSEAKAAGYEAIATLTPSLDRAHYYPGGKPFMLRLVADAQTERLLGAQAVGAGEVVKRIDVLAAVLTWQGTLKDISDLDLAYAPPFATAVDPVANASNQTRNQLAGLAKAIDADAVKRMLGAQDELVLLDVREPNELARSGFEEDGVMHVPLTALRGHDFDIPKDREIITICQSGLRGYEACLTMQSRGFTKVRFLQGGLKAW